MSATRLLKLELGFYCPFAAFEVWDIAQSAKIRRYPAGPGNADVLRIEPAEPSRPWDAHR